MSCPCVSEGCRSLLGLNVEHSILLSAFRKKKKKKVRHTEVSHGVNLKAPELNRRHLFISTSILLSRNYSSIQHSY